MARIFSKFAFRNLLTLTEKAAITAAGNTDPVVRVFLDDLTVADEVDLDDPAVSEGLNYLASIGLLTPERVVEILSAPIADTPPTYTVTIKAMDTITPQNISGAVQREDGKWIVRGEFTTQSTTHILEMGFDVCPSSTDIDARIVAEIIALRGVS